MSKRQYDVVKRVLGRAQGGASRRAGDGWIQSRPHRRRRDALSYDEVRKAHNRERGNIDLARRARESVCEVS